MSDRLRVIACTATDECIEAGCDIDMHGPLGCDYHSCDAHPSVIARALLTAEPSAEEVERAAEAYYAGGPLGQYELMSDHLRGLLRNRIRAALIAARRSS